MKSILKHFIVDTVTLYVVSQSVSGMVFLNGVQTLFITGAVLTGVTLIAKPVINILLLPINLVTFGLFRWVAYAVTFYLVTLIVPAFKLMDFSFKGYDSFWFSIPPIFLTGMLAFLAFAFVISIVSSLIYWIFK